VALDLPQRPAILKAEQDMAGSGLRVLGFAKKEMPANVPTPSPATSVLLRAYAFLGSIEAVAAMAGYFYVLGQGGWAWGQVPSGLLYRQATTACLSAVVVTQIANGFVCRSARQSVWSLGLFSNRLLLLGILVEAGLLLVIVYTPLGQTIFGTAALPVNAWLAVAPFAPLLLAADEGRKALARRRG
jgi:sodium/potassium-transporting ATPase subunit alpha